VQSQTQSIRDETQSKSQMRHRAEYNQRADQPGQVRCPELVDPSQDRQPVALTSEVSE